MLPDIGIMVGLYIITRMFSFLTRKEPRSETVGVKIFAVITILITIIMVADLVLRGNPSALE